MTKITDRRMKKVAGVLDTYNGDYVNQEGKVTPYHILFKDFGDQIGSMEKDEAVQFVVDKINELQVTYGGDPDYSELSDSDISYFVDTCNGVRDGMGVLFKVKDFLLASENGDIVASINTILKHPKTATKVASIIGTMLKAHQASIESKHKNNE